MLHVAVICKKKDADVCNFCVLFKLKIRHFHNFLTKDFWQINILTENIRKNNYKNRYIQSLSLR